MDIAANQMTNRAIADVVLKPRWDPAISTRDIGRGHREFGLRASYGVQGAHACQCRARARARPHRRAIGKTLAKGWNGRHSAGATTLPAARSVAPSDSRSGWCDTLPSSNAAVDRGAKSRLPWPVPTLVLDAGVPGSCGASPSLVSVSVIASLFQQLVCSVAALGRVRPRPSRVWKRAGKQPRASVRCSKAALIVADPITMNSLC